jgi:hypothetical protein
MRTPTLARSTATRFTLLLTTAFLLAACAGDVTTPTATKLAPTHVTKALVGAVDGVYTFTVDPNSSQTVSFGKSYVSFPAGSICALGTSSYGPSTWNDSCVAETGPVTITATVRNAQTNNPSVDFEPAMRFSPATTVQLYLYVTNAATLSNMTVMRYCSATGCVDESITDASLQTSIDATQGLVFRRIKHFSGYVVNEFNDDGTPVNP